MNQMYFSSLADFPTGKGWTLIGLEIKEVKLVEEVLTIEFVTGETLSLWDAGQNCCESRYASCDDDLSTVKGKLVSITVQAGPNLDDGEAHEQEFLVVQTSLCSFTVVNHNEHNGYYGGFCLNWCVS